MRILHIAADLDRRKGGPTAACIGLAELMARRGHEVRIVTTDRGYAPPAPEPPGNLAIEALPGSWPAFFGTSWPLHRRLDEVVPEADVVHLHSLYLFHDWSGARACWRFRKPYIVRPHGTLDPYIYRRHRWRKLLAEALFQRRVLRRAAGLHYTAADEWLLARPQARNPRGAIVPIGIDAAAFASLPPRSALRGRYPGIGARKVVLFLGRLSYKKGLDVVIDAVAEVARGGHDVFLLIAGPDDGVRDAAEQRIRARGIEGRALFAGMVTGAQKLEVLAGSDVFLLPSQSENFGITVVEAAACRVPVVISDRVNLWREFQEAGAALVGPPEAGPFAAHLRFLLENPAEAAGIAERGAALVRRNFDWDALGPRYEAMYAEAIGTGKLQELS